MSGTPARVVGGVLGVLVASGLALGAGVGDASRATAAAGATPAGPAQAAAGWLGSQLTKGGGFLPGPFDPTVADWGLTEDAVLALTAAGQGEGAPARAAAVEIASHVGDFVTWDSFDPSYKGKVLLAGTVAKTMLVAQVQGADPTAFGKRDLDADLRSLLATSGAQRGRFKDKNEVDTSADADTSNGFGQALAVIALSRTADGVPADAVDYLLQQQCPAGGFRLFYDTKATCTANGDADTDATALAVQALAALPTSGADAAAVTAALASATSWLAAGQSATTGALSSSGPSAAPNTNTTGLGALALRIGGASAAADHAAAYVAGLQIGGGSTAGKNAGAIGYDKAAFTAAKGGSIGSADLDQWRRATTQALFGFSGMPSYATMAAVSAAPSPTGNTTSGTSSSSTHSTSGSSHSSHSAHPSSSTARPTVLGERISATTDPASLAATGGLPWGQLWLAAGLLVVGVGLLRVRRPPARRH